MVQTVTAILPTTDGQLNIDLWLRKLSTHYSSHAIKVIGQALSFVQLNSGDALSAYQNTCLQTGIEIANILISVKADHESICAAILYPSLQCTDLAVDDIGEHFGKHQAKLVNGVDKLSHISHFGNTSSLLIDNLRQMLLTMVDDVRVVLIKLAERCVAMRNLDDMSVYEQQQTAKQTNTIYAPLANRLGISELKWELEDLCFRYYEPEHYRQLAKQLKQRRVQREQYIQTFIDLLSSHLKQANIAHDIKGRAKHIYSIYKKMQRKQVSYEEIYDAFAIRVLTDSIEDCYQVLSIVHTQWQHVAEEFDDYIATPKGNGYQSIHTVAIGPEGRAIEVQIRTHEMHEKNELGVAAHWLYKENASSSNAAFEQKVAWLRQLLDWQQEMVEHEGIPEHLAKQSHDARVYVFTPGGDVISLNQGATALDFAYHIHSDIGHRCRGAKANGKIITLTQPLNTGDRIEIITSKESKPSRDWLNPHSGYLHTARAKSKVHSWFKKQDVQQHISEGQLILDRESKRHDWKAVNFDDVAKRFHLKSRDELITALGNGDIRVNQLQTIVRQITQPTPQETDELPELPKLRKPKKSSNSAITVDGVDDLLTQIAGCCKPLPGDPIVGYITQGKGITIHQQSCTNIQQAKKQTPERIVSAEWTQTDTARQLSSLVVEASDTPDLLRDITAIMSQEKINIIDLKMTRDKKQQLIRFYLSVELNSTKQLNKLLLQLRQLNNVYQAFKH